MFTRTLSKCFVRQLCLGISLALDAIEHARRNNASRGRHHWITHLFLIDQADLSRFAELDVTADVQLTPTSIDPRSIVFYRSIIGNRADSIITVEALLEAGAHVTMSSDWDADELNPLLKIEQAVARVSGEAIPDVMTALRMLTINPAV